MERRKLIKQYLLSLAVIFCIFAFTAGLVTVKEKTRFNMDGSDYARVELYESEGKLHLCCKSKDGKNSDISVAAADKDEVFSFMGEVFESIGEFFDKNVH